MNSWNIILSDQFNDWYDSLDDKDRENVLAVILLLKDLGPQLTRPHSDTLNGSSYPNMKELRIQSKGNPLRAFYAFDPERNAILLCAGNKKGKKEKNFYQEMISLADKIFEAHLDKIKK